MELRISEYQLPAPIKFNFDELKGEISWEASLYSSIVYAPAEIKTAKADRAKLNRLKKKINDERIRQERIYLEPFQAFKVQCAELIGMIDTAVTNVDRQIKAFEAESKPAEDEPERTWVKFEACVSAAEAKALSAFLMSAGIDYRRLK